MKILIIDDDKNFIDLISEYLSNYDIDVVSATTLDDGRNLINVSNADHVLVDIMIPGGNGLDLIKEMSPNSNSKFYILTGDTNMIDRSIIVSGILIKEDLISGIKQIINARRHQEVS